MSDLSKEIERAIRSAQDEESFIQDVLIDALGWEIPTFESFFERADAMLAGGYSLESG